MIYILIAVMYAYGGSNVVHIEFDGRPACEKALENVKSYARTAVCVPKGS